MKKVIDKVALIHILDYKILSTLSKNKDCFFLPGGKRENDESDMECLKREILEELSVDLIEESIRYFGTFVADAYGHSKDTIVKMTCYFADYSGELRANNEIDRFEWLTFDDKEKSSQVDQIIFDTLHAQGLIK